MKLQDFTQLSEGIYEIDTKEKLDYLSAFVNDGNDCNGITFRQTAAITYDGTENNFVPIGNDVSGFCGSFDGRGFTISGIDFKKSLEGHKGLFGKVLGGIIENVILDNSSFRSKGPVGGIVGTNAGTVRNCRVESSVSIMAEKAGRCGGIVGDNDGGSVCGCISAATCKGLVPDQQTGGPIPEKIGGIVGSNKGTVIDCFFTSFNVGGVQNFKGAIAGENTSTGIIVNNYYLDCVVKGIGKAGVDYPGTIVYDFSYDLTGACRARRITLGNHVGIVGEGTTYSVSGITPFANNVLCYDNTYYSGNAHTVTLSYSGEVPEGYKVAYSATGGTISSNILTMPNTDVTVTATLVPIMPVIAGHLYDGVYWATYYNQDARFTLPAGATAYTMGTDYQLYRLGTDGRTIPKNTAVVILSDVADIELTSSDDNSEIAIHGGGNILQGGPATLIDGKIDGKTPYVLGIAGSPAALGFYKFTGESIPANKAYYVQ